MRQPHTMYGAVWGPDLSICFYSNCCSVLRSLPAKLSTPVNDFGDFWPRGDLLEFEERQIAVGFTHCIMIRRRS